MNAEQKLNKEIAVLYKGSLPETDVAKRSNLTFRDFLSDKMSVIKIIREGVPYSLFVSIKAVAPFSEGDWAELLHISTKSLLRYKQTEKQFKPLQSEKIIEMAEVAKAGLDVFGSLEKFRLWLNTPVFSLGNMKPMELLKDSYGKELVLAELTRIEHGIFV